MQLTENRLIDDDDSSDYDEPQDSETGNGINQFKQLTQQRLDMLNSQQDDFDDDYTSDEDMCNDEGAPISILRILHAESLEIIDLQMMTNH